MRIKKYEADDIKTALAAAKQELGPHALILSTRWIKKGQGAFGMLARPRVELTAAVDRDFGETSSRPAQTEYRQRSPEWTHEIATLRLQVQKIDQNVHSFKEMLSSIPGFQDLHTLREEIEGLKKSLLLLSPPAENGRPSSLPPSLESVFRTLLANGVRESVALSLLEELGQEIPPDKAPSFSEIQSALIERLKGSISVAGPITPSSDSQTVIAFMGPTGVGKTTTVAKLAAAAMKEKNQKVAMITTDTDRIASLEHIQMYAKTLGIPIQSAISPEEMKRAVNTYTDKDLILIDTTGFNPRDTENLRELNGLLSFSLPVETHLVMSATSKEEDLFDINRRFSAIPFHRYLVTKIDETSSFGPLFNFFFEAKRPLSYFTTGQRVPDDIEIASGARLAEAIVNLN